MMSYEEWVQANEADLNAGWEDPANKTKFQDVGEYLMHWYARYVLAEKRKQEKAA